MTDSSISKPILVGQETGQVQMKVERRQLVWRLLFSFGAIAGVVMVATVIAHWMRPIR
jgi:hypothetical protein